MDNITENQILLNRDKSSSIPNNSEKNKKRNLPSLEDFLISLFESLTGVFDQVYFLKTIGLIKETSFIYRKFYKNKTSLKIWFVSLCLNLRRSCKRLFLALRLRNKLIFELSKITRVQKEALNPTLIKKFNKQLDLIKCNIYEYLWEILDSLIYLFLVSIDLFESLKKYKKYQHTVDRIATATNILRFIFSVKTGWQNNIV